MTIQRKDLLIQVPKKRRLAWQIMSIFLAIHLISFVMTMDHENEREK